MFEILTRPPKESPVGTYRLEVVSLPEECDWDKYLPIEIRYIFARNAEYKEKIRAILKQGKAIGVRTVKRTPENILKAIHTISVHSQENYIVTWLPKLLRDKHRPVFTDADRARAASHKEDLDAAIEIILRDRLRFKRLVLIDEENIGITNQERRFMTELSEIIYPLAIDYSVFRVIADNARERTKVAQAIIKALLIIGPIAHVLEKFSAGIGKVFAASADDLLGESAELMALRGSGFTWRELAKRSRILVPVFALATYGAFSVHGLLEEGHTIWGGIVFGLSAVALSLTTAVQSIFMYRRNVKKLMGEGKVTLQQQRHPEEPQYQSEARYGVALRDEGSRVYMGWWATTRLAIIQDFTNPARLGLLLGSGLAPIMGIVGSLLHLMENGWVLAAIGSTESIVAGLTVIFADYINEWRFHKRLKRHVSRHVL